MIILSIDTALRTCGIGVMRDGNPVFSKTELMPRGQDQALAITVQNGLKDAGVIVSGITAIAVVKRLPGIGIVYCSYLTKVNPVLFSDNTMKLSVTI